MSLWLLHAQLTQSLSTDLSTLRTGGGSSPLSMYIKRKNSSAIKIPDFVHTYWGTHTATPPKPTILGGIHNGITPTFTHCEDRHT